MRLALVVAAVLVGIAQAQPDANEILRKVSARYDGAKSLEMLETIHITTRRQKDGEPVREKVLVVHAAFQEPGKYLVEITGEPTKVSDGTNSDPAGTGPDPAVREKIIEPFRFSTLIQAKVLREERIDAHDCYVMEVHAPWTSEAGDLEWVDKDRLVVLRQENTLTTGGIVETTRADYTVRIDEPLPESLFQFRPPEAAKSGDTNVATAR